MARFKITFTNDTTEEMDADTYKEEKGWIVFLENVPHELLGEHLEEKARVKSSSIQRVDDDLPLARLESLGGTDRVLAVDGLEQLLDGILGRRRTIALGELHDAEPDGGDHEQPGHGGEPHLGPLLAGRDLSGGWRQVLRRLAHRRDAVLWVLVAHVSSLLRRPEIRPDVPATADTPPMTMAAVAPQSACSPAA